MTATGRLKYERGRPMKRILSAVILGAILLSVLAFSSSAVENTLLIAPNPLSSREKLSLTEFKTSNDTSNYFDLSIDGETLKVTGIVKNEDIKFINLHIAGENIVIKNVSGSRFLTKIDLSSVNSDKIELCIYMGKSLAEEFVSAYYGKNIVLSKTDGLWGFSADKAVYESNLWLMQGWVDDVAALVNDVPDRIIRTAESITRDIETNYDKARAIHEYVAETLYYDLDYANRITASTAVTAQEVYDKGVAVCEGYVNLTIALLRAVGIPAVSVEGYALDINDPAEDWDNADAKISNHNWLEAYVDGRWIVMDPTWDSLNTVKNGKKISASNDYYGFFDITPELLSATHKVLNRPNVFGIRGLSDWALEESVEAYRLGLITNECRSDMPSAISRQQFCKLLMNMLTTKTGKSVEKLLEEKGVSINSEAFVDTSDYNVLSANALGIVNGKENGKFDPNGTIKRQEAAAMLQRAAVNVLGVTSPNSTPVEFTDADTFASWGSDAIAFVSASADKNGRRVMGGKEAGRFAPDDLYTKEQSVLTVYRLYTAY